MNRDWLRGFLQLGARAKVDGIPPADIERQEDTVLRALELLEEQPGVVLADEVGMGKTYEALGIAAAFRHRNPRSRIVVVTPGPDLNKKWFKEFQSFSPIFDFKGDIVPTRKLPEFVRAVRRHPIVVAPVTMFRTGRASGDTAYLLSLYCHWRGLHGNTAKAILGRFGLGAHERVDVRHERFLGILGLEKVSPHLLRAFRRGRGEGSAGLDDLYEAGGIAAFENKEAVRKALHRARFVLTGRLMPKIDLLIVDEAHKLKNPVALQTQAMRLAFRQRFRKALFLTATPFQLQVSELREIFSLFGSAEGAPADLEERIEALLSAVAEYQRQYDEFQETWSSLDPVAAARFRTWYDEGDAPTEELEDPALGVVARQIAALKTLKEELIEPGFRQWMIRSLREEKRNYRRHLRERLPSQGVGVLPFLLYERLVAELFRRRRPTHKAAVEINMVSSYAAALGGALFTGESEIPGEAKDYRELLRNILGALAGRAHDHPKIEATVRDALDAAERGEKTLIFCARTATIERMHEALDTAWKARILERWQRIYPQETPEKIFDHREDDTLHRGRHAQLQVRFHRPRDALFLALREPYLRTLADVSGWALAHLPLVVDEANRILAGLRVSRTAAERLDYELAKRCVEQAVALLVPDVFPGKERLLPPDYLRLGLDLEEDEEEARLVGEHPPQWRITARVATAVMGSAGSLWEAKASLLERLPWELRERVVDRLARFLTFRQVAFLPELLQEALAAGLAVESIESAAVLEFLPAFWRTETGARWRERLEDFLRYFVSREREKQEEILGGPIRTEEFVRDSRHGEGRERLGEAFNTPLYPMVLIANEVMQEGLDLHRNCRRIVHHDLGWNPAQIEQRIGRIDRLGSLTSRLREHDGKATLDVLYPVILGTIDERLYRTVRTREKWLEFLLGAPPNFAEYSFGEEEPPPLPDRLGAELTIDLGPRKPTAPALPTAKSA